MHLFLAVGFARAFAIPQIADILIYNGDTLHVFLHLPDKLYRPDTIRTDSSEYVVRTLVNLFGNKRAYPIRLWAESYYYATWEITDNQLYLTGIYSGSYRNDSIKADLTSLFSEKEMIHGKVKADWVSSEKIVKGGKEFLFYLESHYYPVFKQDMEFEFYKGKLINIRIYDNSRSRRSTYSRNYMKLLRFIYSNIDWDHLPIPPPKNKRVVVRFSGNKYGKIDSVEILRKSDSEILDSEAVRVVKLIPDWDVFYVKGKLIRYKWTFPISFDEEKKQQYGK